MNETSPSLASLRHDIDALDERILDLLAERFALAQHLSKDKPLEGTLANTTLSTATLPALRPQREHQILTRLLARSRAKGLPEALILQLWRQLMSATAFVQKPYTISYLKNDALCLVALGTCFASHITLLPQETQSAVVAVLSHEANAFALVSLTTPSCLATEEVPWWRYLFSTHAPRILQSLPSALSDKSVTQRVLLLGRLPSSWLDEGAAFKYFLINLEDTFAEESSHDLSQEISKLVSLKLANLQRTNLADAQPSLLGVHEKAVLVCYAAASHLTSAAIAAELSALGEARHIGSTHDDWATLQKADGAP